jgi:hypothetical protein
MKYMYALFSSLECDTSSHNKTSEIIVLWEKIIFIQISSLEISVLYKCTLLTMDIGIFIDRSAECKIKLTNVHKMVFNFHTKSKVSI